MVELEQYIELFNLLKPLREILRPLLSLQENLPFNGLNHQGIIALLPEPPENLESILKAIASTHPSWQDLLVEPERVNLLVEPETIKRWGQTLEASMSTANWDREKEAQKMTAEQIDKLACNFVMDFVGIWAGLIPGAMRIDRRRHLTVTTSDTRHGDTLRAMSQVIMLEATGNQQLLAKRLGVNPDELIEIEQELPALDNLTVVNVQMSGMSSNQWSDNCQNRLDALIEHLRNLHPGITILGPKKYVSALELNGWWFKDNRGSNALVSQNVIATIGTPRINLGVAEDEYLTLYGSLNGFEDYYQSLINSEVTQLIGRPRAHLFPDTQFTIYMVGTNQDLDYLKQYGIKIINRHAFEITPEAGTQSQVSKWQLLQGLLSLIKAGKKITQQALSKISRISQSYLSELVKTYSSQGWSDFKKLSEVLLKSYRVSDNFWESLDPQNKMDLKKWLELGSV